MKVMITEKDNKKVFELSKELFLSAKVFAEREKYTVSFDSKELGIMFNILSELLMDLIETREAAEFEARVAQLIAMPCKTIPPNIHGKSSAWTKLRLARLAVESEMDAEHGNEA
jgi:hypothetical protein